MDFVTQIKRARAVGAPLIALATPDQPSAMQALRDPDTGINGGAPLIGWDCVRAFRPMNDAGQEAFNAALASRDPMQMANFIDAAIAMAELPDRTVVIAMNGHRLFNELPAVQAVMNLRDEFKATRRTLILLGPDFNLPVEIASDVLQIDEALPTPERIREIVQTLCEQNTIAYTPETIERAVDALRGLDGFAVEQAAALAVHKDADGLRLDITDLWDRKRRMIATTGGLIMEQWGATFEDIGGLANAKAAFERRFKGRNRPRVIVFIDEIDKAMAGAQGDTSGVSQDAHGVILDEMESRKYNGLIAVGPPGCAKSFIARAVAATYKVPLLKLDLGAAKGSLVGESERKIRAALRTIKAVAGDGGAFFVATCNRLMNISAELRRRFRAGLWMFDLPDSDERRAIAALHAAKYEIEGAPEFFAGREGWSGANIRDAIQNAYDLDCSLDDAADLVVPAATQDPEGITSLRAMANGRFLSASRPGKYQMPATMAAENKATPSIRRLAIND